MPSQEPQFPASVLLGFSFGLAFWGGSEGLLGVRQLGEVNALRGAQPLHQRLQLVLLLLEVQLHTAAGEQTDMLLAQTGANDGHYHRLSQCFGRKPLFGPFTHALFP